MSFFEQMAGKELPKVEEAEVKVDLSGMEKPDALQKPKRTDRASGAQSAVIWQCSGPVFSTALRATAP